MSSPPASPLSSWSSPPPQIPFPPLPPILSPPLPVLSPAPPPSPIRSLDYRAAMIQLRDEAASTSSPPLQLPSARESSSAAAARPAGGLRADYGFVATMDREIMRDPQREVGYEITNSWDEIVETLQGAPVSTDTELGGYMREFETRVRKDTDEIYMRLDDEQTERHLLAGRLNMLFRDRRQMTEIRELQAADRRRQTVISELLRTDHRRSTEIIELRTALQGRVTALQAQFATCTLHSVALTWWNTHIQTVGHEAAYGMPWKTLMKMMTEKYCPQNEIRKLEMELWDLKVKGTDLASYTQRYQELDLLCERMFSKESNKIEKYIGGLLDMIHGSVVASKPKTMQEAIEIATEQMDKKIRTFVEHETASKRKFENTSRNTQNQQQQPNKRQNTGRVYTAASGGRNNASARVYAVGRAGIDPDANVMTDREIMRDLEREVGYGITDSWDEIVETLHGAPVSTDTELGRYVREFETRVRQDTYEIYMRLDDEQTERHLLAGQLNMLFRDRRAHAYTRQLMETEARMSRESWVRATDAADRKRQTVISELLRIDHRRSTEISELRTALQGQVTALQGQVTALQAQVTTLQGQQGLVGSHTQSELPEEAGGSA
nr:hypothetical protein [Tanacetum cinerariifolium]